MKKKVLIIGLIIVAAIIYFSIAKNSFNEKPIGENPIMNEGGSSSKIERGDSTQSNSIRYIDYSKSLFDQMFEKKRVYFFHANWCPTCKAANEEFMQNSDKIPFDVILFKTDYDVEKDLKSQYGITYQHTFVYVDSQGIEIKKWNGGGIEELKNNTSQ